MMKRFFARFSLLVLLLLPLWGCGGIAPPPASIPAPVSQLITVNPPDANGNAAIIGSAGSVLPNANVQATNISQGGSFLVIDEASILDLLIPSAHAQQPLVVQTTADDQGRFALDIPANSGDDI